MTTELVTTTRTAMEVAGHVANGHAAKAAFVEYQSRKADNTLRRQRADLALFADFLTVAGIPDAPSGDVSWPTRLHDSTGSPLASVKRAMAGSLSGGRADTSGGSSSSPRGRQASGSAAGAGASGLSGPSPAGRLGAATGAGCAPQPSSALAPRTAKVVKAARVAKAGRAARRRRDQGDDSMRSRVAFMAWLP